MKRRTRDALARTAAELGLTLEGDGLRGRGPRGVEVRLSHSRFGLPREDGSAPRPSTVVVAAIDPPLRMGLRVEPWHLLARGERMGDHCVRSLEPAHARRVLERVTDHLPESLTSRLASNCPRVRGTRSSRIGRHGAACNVPS